MRLFIVCLLVLCEFQVAMGQKQPLDLASIDKWPHIENERISDDGRYLLYDVSSKKEGTTLVIQATTGSWGIRIKNAINAVFTEDNSQVVFKTTTDSLGIVKLGARNFRLLDRIISFALPSARNGEWLVYQMQAEERELIILDLFTGFQKKYSAVKDFEISVDGFRILLQQTSTYNNGETDSVTCMDLNLGKSYFIWRGMGDYNWKMDNSGSQVSFLRTRTVNNENENELWYYKAGMDSAILLVNDSTKGMEGAKIGRDMPFFSGDGGNLFFSIHSFRGKSKSNLLNKEDHFILWSYQDKFLDESSEKLQRDFQVVLNLQMRRRIVSIERKDGDDSYASSNNCYSNNNVLYSASCSGFFAEYGWDALAHRDLYIVSTLAGARKLLTRNCSLTGGLFGFSPARKYVYWFDLSKRQWFSYNLGSGITRNVSARIPFLLANNDVHVAGSPRAEGMVGWMENDAGLLIYDKYDIWEVDPKGIKLPRNITLGYGRKHHTILRLLNLNETVSSTFSLGDTLRLSTFNILTKQNGFAQIALNGRNDLIILAQGPKRYYGVLSRGLHSDPIGQFGMKAKYTSAYIFKPTCDTMYPNLCFSGDLIHFKQLTDFEPQKQYNWYTSELIHWRRPDGIANDGILYKPEDFNPNKKYPLIIFIYETFSDALNVFLAPALCRGDMEILWYISHDYLVLVPDIHYVIGHPGESAYNSVSSSVRYLSGLPWVDMKHLGLQGHSFGGYETNYIITRTNVFAAASSANGISDLISESGSMSGGRTMQTFLELGQGRMGTTLWRRPDLYIYESPIYNANKINTPVLIVHNPLDNAVHFSQGVEWFAALRRLGKKAWMLQYTNEGHNIEEEENKLDYTVRLSQFFDHFLKGMPAPQWMKGG